MNDLCKRVESLDDRGFEILVMGLFGVMAAVIFAVVQFTDMHSSVVEGYFPYADAMMNGVFPYTDEVFVYGYWNVWEYPPLAYVLFFIPRLFGTNLAVYQAVYLVLVMVSVWLGLRSVRRIAEIRDYNPRKACIVYVLFMALMAEFLFDRYDVFPVILTIMAIRFFLEGRYEYASAMVAVGTLLKLYPALLLPVFIIWLIRRKEWKGLLYAAIAFLVLMCIAIPFVLLGDISQMFGYHSARPLEIESFAASILEVVRLISPDSGMEVIYSYGSDNLVGGIADSVSLYMTKLMLGCIGAILVYYIYLVWTKDEGLEHRSFNTMFLIVSAFMMVGAIFSAQYVIWLIPFVLVFLMYVGDKGKRRAIVRVFAVIEVLTQLNFLFNFGMRPDDFLSPWGVASILIRNILLLLMMVYAVRDLPRDIV